MGTLTLQNGDWIIYRKQKVSTAPGPRAQETMPASKGDTYNYVVEKYWVVEQILNDGKIQLRTRRGKVHVVSVDDPRIRRPKWWERWLLSSRFRAVEESIASGTSETVLSDS